ncbi:MAG TPA: sulfotransferase [Mycobacteriales bacterium]|nr:sulfotransferase [Mycobacteriales bacterium]
MSDSPGSRHLVLVVGAGRSGTSLTAGIFGQLGFHVPQPEVQANFTNPRGFGEPRWVVDFHAGLMRQQDIELFDARPEAWDAAVSATASPEAAQQLHSWLTTQFASHDRVVVKDPRTVWFLPLWQRCVGDLGIRLHYVTTLRHPTEVLRSIRTTAGAEQTEASRAAWWVATTLHAEHATRGAARAFLLYDDLLVDWRRELEHVERAAGLPLVSSADAAALTAVDELVDPSLRRSESGWADVDVPGPVQQLAENVWGQMTMLARGDAAQETGAALDELRSAYDRLYREAASIADSTVQHAVRSRAATAAAHAPAPTGWTRRMVRRLPPPVLTRVRRMRRHLGGQRRR